MHSAERQQLLCSMLCQAPGSSVMVLESRDLGVTRSPAHLVFVWVAAIPEPQAQELLVDAQGLLAGRMPLLIAVCQPVPERHRGTPVQCAVCQLQVVIWAEQGWQGKVAATTLVWWCIWTLSWTLQGNMHKRQTK